MELRAFQILTQHAHLHLCVNPPSNIQSPIQALWAQMLSVKEVETTTTKIPYSYSEKSNDFYK